MSTRKKEIKIPVVGKGKRTGAVQRMQCRRHSTPMPPQAQAPTQREVDAQVIDLIMKALYNNGDSQVKSLTTDILDPLKIDYNEKGLDRTWDVIMNTGLISPVIGFNSLYKLELTPDGYKVMSQFGSYINYVEEMQRQSAAQHPQAIFNQEKEEDKLPKQNEIANNAAASKPKNDITNLSIE